MRWKLKQQREKELTTGIGRKLCECSVCDAQKEGEIQRERGRREQKEEIPDSSTLSLVGQSATKNPLIKKTEFLLLQSPRVQIEGRGTYTNNTSSESRDPGKRHGRSSGTKKR